MAAAEGFALFDTAIGACGVAWGDDGIVGMQLPEGPPLATRAHLRRRFPQAREIMPPDAVRAAMRAVVTLLRGEPADLCGIRLDMTAVPEFHRRVYAVARTIPAGTTLAYGEIARRLGEPGAARAVGQALGRNPFALIVPCHRVLAARGGLGGFSAAGGVATKQRLLAIEGATAQRGLFDGDAQLGFDPQAAVAHLRGADAALARVIDAVGPLQLELKRTSSVFAALAEAIVHQQLNGKAAATIYARVCAACGAGAGGPEAMQIQRATDTALRGAGLSAAKLAALRDLTTRFHAGEIPTLAEARQLDDATLIERLTAVRGIGRWTVEMLLIFRLGRADVLPVDDYGVRQGYAVALRRRALPERAELAARGARWQPYRTAASWYLWRAAERARSTPAKSARG
ncbi:MAG: methylated-DNA--[protein]-cysteine S-methyltransferase [Deltaproteobacteria bacterium]|nr:methylated-DNA--[protein]-cysteine S-methyltransferase [Deltaproteobacteria bacterium]